MKDNPITEMEGQDIDRWLSDTMTSSLAMGISSLSHSDISFKAKRMAGTLVDYKDLMMMYACAMKEVQTKFEVLNTEFNVRYQRNPICSINTRLKKTPSIREKLAKQGHSFSLENIEKYIHDVAGVRIICPYIDDIYTIADALLRQDDITLINRKDYIQNPKDNGYRSLHLIIKIPVFFAKQRKDMYVEVQIRTIAMDFWASLEHQLKYKQNVEKEDEIIAKLKDCADVISSTDLKMLEIRNEIEKSSVPSEDDILLAKLSKIDININ